MNKEYRCPVCNAMDSRIKDVLATFGKYVHDLHTHMDALEYMLKDTLQELGVESCHISPTNGKNDVTEDHF